MTISLRLDEIQEQMINDLIEKEKKKYPFIKITKSDIIRMAINHYHYERLKERRE